jgi:hypothetical protein
MASGAGGGPDNPVGRFISDRTRDTDAEETPPCPKAFPSLAQVTKNSPNAIKNPSLPYLICSSVPRPISGPMVEEQLLDRTKP